MYKREGYRKVTVALAAMLIAYSSCYEAVAGKTKVFTSANCSRKAPTGTDCSTLDAGTCHLTLEDGVPTDIEDRGLAPNTRSCYRTCVSPQPPFPDRCEVDKIMFENQTLRTTPGMNGDKHFILSSPNYNAKKRYKKSTICRYLVSCGPGQLASFMVTDQLLENTVSCSNGADPQCADALTFSQYGGQVTTCGKTPHPSDVEPEQLLVRFKTNRKIEDCGFNVYVTCSDITSFFRPACVVPGKNQFMSWPEVRRDALMLPREQVFKVRSKRCHRVPYITVPLGATVNYSNNTVQVLFGSISMYRFTSIVIFQVYNRAEGYITFYGDGPKDRVFPGYGFVKVGDGAIHYVQEGIPPEYRPNPDEEAVIRTFQQAIALKLENATLDEEDDEDRSLGISDLITSTSSCQSPDFTLLAGNSLNFDVDISAMMYSNACNGFLKVAACAFQTTVLGLESCV